MNKFRAATLVALTLFCSGGVLAKTMKVRIQGDQDAAKEIAKSIAARLKGMERYAVTDGDADLYLHLSCMAGREVANSSGYICSFVFVYYPEKMSSMQSVLNPYG